MDPPWSRPESGKREKVPQEGELGGEGGCLRLDADYKTEPFLKNLLLFFQTEMQSWISPLS